jgi:hypothetical protein
MTFEAAPAASFAPQEIHTFSTPNDPTVVLPEAAAAKFVQLKQRCLDLHSQVPEFADVRELADTKIRHQQRIQRLLMARAEGGFGLAEDAASVVDERRKLERVDKELQRMEQLRSVRGQRWTVAKQLEARISDWVLRGGVPGDCLLEVVADAPVSELLKKGERIADAVERYRHRLRELAADLHRVRSSPWPSSVAKQKAEALIEQLAAAPDFDSMIEHNSALAFPSVSLSSFVRGTEPALAFTEAQAQISSDVLAIERAEVACIWHAETQNNEILDFRADTSPQALLGLRLVNQPRANVPGTTGGHAYDIVHGGRR